MSDNFEHMLSKLLDTCVAQHQADELLQSYTDAYDAVEKHESALCDRIAELESLLRECESMLLYCHNYVPTPAMDRVNKLHSKVMDAVGQP